MFSAIKNLKNKTWLHWLRWYHCLSCYQASAVSNLSLSKRLFVDTKETFVISMSFIRLAIAIDKRLLLAAFFTGCLALWSVSVSIRKYLRRTSIRWFLWEIFRPNRFHNSKIGHQDLSIVKTRREKQCAEIRSIIQTTSLSQYLWMDDNNGVWLHYSLTQNQWPT